MPIVKPLPPTPQEKHNTKLKKLADQMYHIRQQDEIKKFLDEILTYKELEKIFVRLEIIKMLDQGHSQRTIAQALRVSIVTVSRMTKHLQDRHHIWRFV